MNETIKPVANTITDLANGFAQILPTLGIAALCSCFLLLLHGRRVRRLKISSTDAKETTSEPYLAASSNG